MRHRLKRLFAETVYRMRTVGASPERQAIALAIGVFIGCSPLFGLHLALCLIAARLFRLSPVTMYAGAQISYPVFAPFLYFAEVQTGAWLRRGEFIDISLATLRAFDHAEFVAFVLRVLGDMVTGSIVLGAILGALFGAVSYQLFTRTAGEPERIRIAGEASRRYLESSIFDWEYARGKIKGDPVYLEILRRRLLPDEGMLVDLGCGRGFLLSLIDEAETLLRDGGWPADWPPPPRALTLHGIDMRRKQAHVARTALGARARIDRADLRRVEVPPADAIVLIDVLHYIGRAEQDDVLRRAAAALRPGGVLLLREADTAPRWRYLVTRTGERLAAILRGALRQRFCFRPIAEWAAALERLGFTVEVIPTMSGTPYSNVLLHARRRDS